MEIGRNSYGSATKFPRTSSGYDTIWVIVDRLTKSAYFLPMLEDYKMDRLARLYLNEIVARHGVPILIISDCDSRFTLRPMVKVSVPFELWKTCLEHAWYMIFNKGQKLMQNGRNRAREWNEPEKPKRKALKQLFTPTNATMVILSKMVGGINVHTIQGSKIDGKEAVWIGRPGLKLGENSSSLSQKKHT
nr:reverse transcriptase domain-containing protein [Tanacetum cinerariifolium]GEX37477.1 reverse transcriptase domain-containing protein [Tanacetum cinerariifolium]